MRGGEPLVKTVMEGSRGYRGESSGGVNIGGGEEREEEGRESKRAAET